MDTFRLTMHEASEGDALQLSWGRTDNLHHAIVDLGRAADFRRLRPLLSQLDSVELLVISHIDADHIAGAVPLVGEEGPPFKPQDVWFNAWHHLDVADRRRRLITGQAGLEILGARQAEKLSEGIAKLGWTWNGAFAGSGVVSVDSPEAGAPISLPGGLELTLLSPSDLELSMLKPVWEAELAKAGLRPTDPDELSRLATSSGAFEVLGSIDVEELAARPFIEDRAPANGSSIAFIARYGASAVLFGADAHPGVIEQSLRRLGYSEHNPLQLDLFKVSHHGSRFNTSNSLLRILDCTCFAVSTDGSRHGHPDGEAIARILANDRDQQKTLFFNSAQPSTEIWRRRALEEEYRYQCRFPQPGTSGIAIEITGNGPSAI